MRLRKIPIQNILFLDIETVPQFPSFEKLPNRLQELFEKRSRNQRKQDEVDKFYQRKAGIWAEFGKIICISCGIVTQDETIRIKSFFGEEEKSILQDFSSLLDQYFASNTALLCAHNGKEFDFPYLGRRMLVNGLPLPSILDLQGLKPWQIRHIDTMELWRFGDYKNYTSLDLLTEILNIPSPKSDISGADVANVYYTHKDLDRIAKYCEKDVVAIVQLFRRFCNQPLLPIA